MRTKMQILQEEAQAGALWHERAVEAEARVAELEGELESSRAEVERLNGWATEVRDRAYYQPYAGARYECRYCGRIEASSQGPCKRGKREHNEDCLMADESKCGGDTDKGDKS